MYKKVVNSLFEKRRTKVPVRTKIFVENSLFFSNIVKEVLKHKGYDQATLARLMNKQQSEISKMLSGTHNFTLRSIAAIEEAIGERVLKVEKPFCVRTEESDAFIQTSFSFENELNSISVANSLKTTHKVMNGLESTHNHCREQAFDIFVEIKDSSFKKLPSELF